VIVIGIDPGVTTGFAVWDALSRKLLRVESHSILKAHREVLFLMGALVVFEDARKIRIGGGATFGDRNRLQGVGSVKRDSAIWEEFLTMHGLPFVSRKASATKLDDEPFRKLTGWTGRTNNHARDAAMIVFGLNVPMVAAMLRDFQLRRSNA
jgi:hypothetical protein